MIRPAGLGHHNLNEIMTYFREDAEALREKLETLR